MNFETKAELKMEIGSDKWRWCMDDAQFSNFVNRGEVTDKKGKRVDMDAFNKAYGRFLYLQKDPDWRGNLL